MLVITEGMKVKVSILPFEQSIIDKNAYVRSVANPLYVESVANHEGKLVSVTIDDRSMVISGEQLITAVQKCLA